MTDKQNRIDAVTNWLDEKYPGHSVERPTGGLPRNSVEAWQIMGESGIHAVRVSLLGIQEECLTGGWSSEDIIDALDQQGAGTDLSIKGTQLLLRSHANELIVVPWDV